MNETTIHEYISTTMLYRTYTFSVISTIATKSINNRGRKASGRREEGEEEERGEERFGK